MPAAETLTREPDALIALVTGLREENTSLRALVETLKRALYGARSEKLEPVSDQLLLGLGDLSTAPVELPKLIQPRSLDQWTRPRSTRNIGHLPTHLPRDEIIIEPTVTACPCCQGKLHLVGEDISEMLDIVPALIRVRRIRRPRYGCRACAGAIVQASAPPRPLDGGLPTTALLAHIVVSKFAWHLPLYRQTQMLAGHGIKLDRSTLVHWVSRAAWWLKPLHELLVATVLAAPKVFCDDTPLPVLDRNRTRTRIARLWSYATDDRPWQGPAPPAVVYLFAEDRKGRHVAEHLLGFNGVLQVDAYGGYAALARPERSGGAITLAFCLAHARRRFFEVHKATGSPVAAAALARFAAIYAIEARIRGTSARERVAIRQAETRLLFDILKPWLMDRLAEISVKAPLARAIRYTLGHWDGLTMFLRDGRVEVDNNTVERTIRPIALGRKNALFAGAASGGQSWAVLASLINTAKLHDLDPHAYLADVLDRMVSGQTKNNAVRELLPWVWKATQATRTAAA
ncbi:IS66 family transposase [Acetobacteraceae bacterium]|nr:IS66 family transposase [Acetobacteraceae bacterium]